MSKFRLFYVHDMSMLCRFIIFNPCMSIYF